MLRDAERVQVLEDRRAPLLRGRRAVKAEGALRRAATMRGLRRLSLRCTRVEEERGTRDLAAR